MRNVLSHYNLHDVEDESDVMTHKEYILFVAKLAIQAGIFSGVCLALFNSIWSVAHHNTQLLSAPINPLFSLWVVAGAILSLSIIWRCTAENGAATVGKIDQFASRPWLASGSLAGTIVAGSFVMAIILNGISGITTSHFAFELLLGTLMVLYGFYLGILVCREMTPRLTV
jgi:hypothetical protein